MTDLCERLLTEARQERICDTCGGVRDHIRVYRREREGNSLTHVMGRMRFVCFNCHPEFVVNPYDVWHRPVVIGH